MPRWPAPLPDIRQPLRLISVAAVQQHLHAAAAIGTVQMKPYLLKLCQALSQSMIGDDRAITLTVGGAGGSADCRSAESLGLMCSIMPQNCSSSTLGIGESQLLVAWGLGSPAPSRLRARSFKFRDQDCDEGSSVFRKEIPANVLAEILQNLIEPSRIDLEKLVGTVP